MNRWSIFLVLMLGTACSSEYSGKTPPPIVEGRIDLSDWDFAKDGPLKLDGEWHFAWKRFVDPSTSPDMVAGAFADVFEVPSYWNDGTLIRSNSRLSSIGFGTYALTIDGLGERTLGLLLPDALSALCIYSTEGPGLVSMRYCKGVPADRAEDEVGYYFSYEVMPIRRLSSGATSTSSLTLMMEVSNFVHARGGISRTISLHSHDELSTSVLNDQLRKTFALGILFCFGFYHLILYRSRRDDAALLFFGAFVLATIIRELSTGSIRLFHTEPSELVFDVLIRLEYISIPLCIISGALFINTLVPSAAFQQVTKWLVVVGSIFSAIPMVTTVEMFSKLALVYQSFAALSGIIIVLYLCKCAVSGSDIASYMLAAFGILLVAIVNDILHTRGVIYTDLFLAEALVLVVIAQAMILAVRSGRMQERLVRLTEHLQDEVEAQTVELNQKRLAAEVAQKEVQQLNDYITESVLKRYLPPTLIGDILSGALSMDKPAELRDVTVLFSDLKGFTATSEALGPERISAYLNEYLTVMNEVIFEYGGTIDKFIGDAIMVLFGAPQDMPPEEQVRRASDCAKAMQRRMVALTDEWKNDGAGHLQMRIGIHHGKAVVGNFGSTQRSDYTAIGPCVNLAARIEAASEPGHVFVSEETAQLMGDAETQKVGSFELKGIEGKATLYRVL